MVSIYTINVSDKSTNCLVAYTLRRHQGHYIIYIYINVTHLYCNINIKGLHIPVQQSESIFVSWERKPLGSIL